MATLVVPYFHSATVLAQHTTAAVVPAVSPWRRILAVEPDVAVLHAKSRLLAKANYCVTQASSDRELFNLLGTQAVPLAILSDRLGLGLLGTVAQMVRRQWPRTRILILGQVPRVLDDFLYDEQISRSPDPKQVLADLESLYSGMWNRRSNTLDWNAARSSRSFARPKTVESDPTKRMEPEATEADILRDTHVDMRPSRVRLQ